MTKACLPGDLLWRVPTTKRPQIAHAAPATRRRRRISQAPRSRTRPGSTARAIGLRKSSTNTTGRAHLRAHRPQDAVHVELDERVSHQRGVVRLKDALEVLRFVRTRTHTRAGRNTQRSHVSAGRVYPPWGHLCSPGTNLSKRTWNPFMMRTRSEWAGRAWTNDARSADTIGNSSMAQGATTTTTTTTTRQTTFSL